MMDPQRLAEWRRTHPPIQGADPTTDPTADRPASPPPREGLVRAIMPGVEVRAEVDQAAGTETNTLFGHFSRFNTWTEINSFIEGHFLEMVAPNATRKTLREQRPKVLLNHGMDPMLGDRVIATPTVLREDDEGSYYEARLFDGLDPVLLAGLRAGEYGASFRFNVVRDAWNDNPDPSDHNPKGLRERTLKEVRVSEFGPVTFPAYADATAGIRSMTDEVVLGRAVADPERLQQYLDYLRQRDERRPADPRRRRITVYISGRVRDQEDAALAAAVRSAVADDDEDDAVTPNAPNPPPENPAPGSAPEPPSEQEGAPDPAPSPPEPNTQNTQNTPSTETAPPEDRAEQHAHPADGRRGAKHTGLYGLNPEENTWRL
jgi:HK97 family phage prohead protease